MEDQFTNMMLGLKVLQEQGINTQEMEAAIRERLSKTQPNMMTTTDGVYIEQSQPDVPGAYVDAYQKQQDLYASQLAKQMNEAEKGAQHSGINAPPTAANLQVQPPFNPNYQVVASPQNVRVGPGGQIIYF